MRKRKSRRSALLIAAVLCLTLIPAPCFAVTLEGDVTLPLDGDWTEADFGLDGVEYSAVNESKGLELGVYRMRNMATNLVGDLSRMKPEDLQKQIEGTLETESESITFDTSEEFRTEQLLFLRFTGTVHRAENGGTAAEGRPYIEYMTIANGGALTLVFYGTGDTIGAAEEAYADEIVRQIRYDRLTGRTLDGEYIRKLAIFGAIAVLLLLSVVWHALRKRKKKRQAEALLQQNEIDNIKDE